MEEKKGFYYGWVIVAVCFCNMCMSTGVSSSFSVFFLALVRHFGWSYSGFSGAFSIYMFIYFVAGILTGTLADRFGLRRIAPLGALLIAAGFLLCSQIRSLLHFYIIMGTIMAFGVSLIGWVPNSTVLAHWFRKKRGSASGIAMSGWGMGMFVFVPLTEWLIRHFGWKTAFAGLAVFVPAVLIPLNLAFMKEKPADMGWGPDGSAPEIPPEAAENASRNVEESEEIVWTLSRAIFTKSYWLIFIALFCNPFVTFSLVLHQVTYVVQKGFNPVYAASAIGIFGLFNVAGRALSGLAADIIGRQRMYVILMTVAFVSFSFFLFLSPERDWILRFYVVAAGLSFGAGATLFPVIVADAFHGRHYGRILGSLSVAGGAGSASGAWITGFLRDVTGSYLPGFTILLVAMAAAAAAIRGTVRPGRGSQASR